MQNSWLPSLFVLAGLLQAMSGADPSSLAGEALRIRIDPARSFQTIDGFGASDAWQCDLVGRNWPLAKRERIADLLFSREADEHGNPKGIGLSIWQSEYCILEENGEIGGGGKRDLGMNTALFVARIIHHDLTIAHAKSWQWWTAVSQVNFKDGLVYLDDGSKGDSGRMGPETLSLMRDGEVRESKLLWTLGNYARFIRPGMVRVACDIAPVQSYVDGLLASAYKGTNGEVVLVLVNLSQKAVGCQLGSDQPVDVYTTSASANLEKSQQNAADIRVPARAVITCIVK